MTPKLYTALRWGAILGGVLAIAEIAAYFLLLRAAQDDLTAARQWFIPVYDSMGLGEMLLEWLVPLGAGFLAAREVGDPAVSPTADLISVGLLAGLTSGGVVALVSIVGALVAAPPPGLLPDDAAASDPVAGILVLTLLTLASGAVGGWLGGRWGASFGGRRQQ